MIGFALGVIGMAAAKERKRLRRERRDRIALARAARVRVGNYDMELREADELYGLNEMEADCG